MRHKLQLGILLVVGVFIFLLNAWSLKDESHSFFRVDNHLALRRARNGSLESRSASHSSLKLIPSIASEEPSSLPSTSGSLLLVPDKSAIESVGSEMSPEIRSSRADFTSPSKNHMHGVLGVDDDGPLWRPIPLHKELREWTAEESRSAHEGYCFNHNMSDSLPLDREPFDARSLLCRVKSYPKMEPASIIIVFVEELFSTLLRSVHSVLNTAPPNLVGEIILVDDGSSLAKRPLLGVFLENYVKRGLPKTRLVRLDNRSGLMHARMVGANMAVFPNLIFLDSHIECSPGWIEPLLVQLSEDYKNVALPVIESIEPHDFTKSGGGIEMLGHTWRLGQTGISGRTASTSEPNDSPIMAGGLFAITKQWFSDLGQYDSEMQLYGGEEMEISFKIWQCGGKLRSIPCSRIGHVFRTNKYWQGQVYPVDGTVITRNKLRAASVWMDQAAEIVRLAFSPLPDTLPLGDLTEPRKVRERLQCHDYAWYHQHVYPELFFPNMSGARSGSIRSVFLPSACIDTLMETQLGNAIGLYSCHYLHGSQAFLLTGDGALRVGALDFSTCVSLKIAALRGGNGAFLHQCLGEKWSFEGTEGKGMLKQSGLCLQAVHKSTVKSSFSLSAAACSSTDPSMLWEWV